MEEAAARLLWELLEGMMRGEASSRCVSSTIPGIFDTFCMFLLVNITHN